MKVVIQRVSQAYVKVNNKTVGEINNGLLLLVGVTHDDTLEDVNYLVKKIINMRIFEDENGKMNISLLQKGYDILSISQFTTCQFLGPEKSNIIKAMENTSMAYFFANSFCKFKSV